MKLNFFIIIVIYTLGFPNAISKRNSRHHLGNPKKINPKGEYERYYGYTIVAMLDKKLEKVAKQVENYLGTSIFKKTYSALPSHTYHMSIYTIYSCGNKFIPPIKKWVKRTGLKVTNRNWLPDDVLEKENNKAMCILEKYMSKSLHIKYASLNIGKTIISLKLEFDEKSLKIIQNARKELAKVYEHPNRSMEPINKKLHITLAYAYGKKGTVNVDAWNELNELVKPFNGANLSLPSLYQYDSMIEYYPFRKNSYIECRAYEW